MGCRSGRLAPMQGDQSGRFAAQDNGPRMEQRCYISSRELTKHSQRRFGPTGAPRTGFRRVLRASPLEIDELLSKSAGTAHAALLRTKWAQLMHFAGVGEIDPEGDGDVSAGFFQTGKVSRHQRQRSCWVPPLILRTLTKSPGSTNIVTFQKARA